MCDAARRRVLGGLAGRPAHESDEHPDGSAPVIAKDDLLVEMFDGGGGPRDAEATLAQCLSLVGDRCRHSKVELVPLDKAGKRQWERVVRVDPATTPDGRECLARGKDSCVRSAKSIEAERERTAWLDAQLTPDRLDRPFSAALAAD